ncbi:dynamin family protein [Curvibacter sp. CHRR-16]|uniref:dynamin family protein n=1 Tax=Curvibacter sp. CHRR-16 TaxID=2835872 RepID=UPI001BDA2AEA|nr:dynamin family protein [Curvibacter sp. CHRR-16]MBT0569587.1 dynamin family protein [Curvibacter sp. CHRR-16]
MSFNEQLDQHGQWRREFALRLRLLAAWLKDHDLLDEAVQDRLLRLETQMQSDKIMVAFVAEFSRGKSELINALFFAGYGRRIMPASAGRTTMCPTELGYDAELPPCLRLLPIETRLQQQTLMDWRLNPDRWERIDLDVNNPQQLALAFEKVAETRKVSQSEAQALGLWNPESPEDNPILDAQGMVEVPRWRHALINVAHPLLKQGLVILDTPGLNAIGAEPELTVSLIPQAQAVVFLLGADTGVTKSDLSIWREHLITDETHSDARLVVLNKIDTLWDALSTPAQVQAQIDRQRSTVAETLALPLERVVAISAQKGLVAKVSDDADLLQRSGLPLLEEKLGRDLLHNRQRVLRSAMAQGVGELRGETARLIRIRQLDLTEQEQELQSLKGKNAGVIRMMRARIAQEQAEFDQSSARVHAVRSVHLKLMRDIFKLLSSLTLKKEMLALTQSLKQKGLKLGIKRSYGDTFDRLRGNIHRANGMLEELHNMLQASFTQLNAEYGFALQVPPSPDLLGFIAELDVLERTHLQYLSLGNALKLAQLEFAERLVRALRARVAAVYDTALAEVEVWSKSSASQIDTQLRERRRHFTRRMDAIDRIQQAAGGLQERIAEIQQQVGTLAQLDAKLQELTSYLMRQPGHTG